MKLQVVFILTSLIAGGYAWSMHKRTILPSVLQFDAYLSAQSQDAIARDLASKNIVEKHPSICKIQTNAHPDHYEILIHSWQPVARINKDCLLAENGNIVAANTYHESVLQTLPQLMVPCLGKAKGDDGHNVKELCTQDLVACVKSADAATWSAGDVIWHKPSYIEFQIREPEISFVCTSNQLQHTGKFIDSVCSVWRNQPADKYDVRFEKQIIAYRKAQELKKG